MAEYNATTGSRFLTAARVDIGANDDDNVVVYADKTDPFILACHLAAENPGENPEASGYILEWQNKTDASGWQELGATGELTYNATTDLVNNTALTEANSRCDDQGVGWVAGIEREGSNANWNINLLANQETEMQWAIDSSGAKDGHEYEFRFADASNSRYIVVVPTITMSMGLSGLQLTGRFTRFLSSLRTYISSLEMSGSHMAGRDLTQSRSGSISFTGTEYIDQFLRGIVKKIVSFKRTMAGSLTFAATRATSLVQVLQSTKTGVLDIVGDYTREVFRIGSSHLGQISFSGIYSKALRLLRTYAGAISPSGIVSITGRGLARTYSGALGLAGAVIKGIASTYTGVLTFVGDVAADYLRYRLPVGSISPAATRLRTVIAERTKAAILSFSKTLSGIKNAPTAEIKDEAGAIIEDEAGVTIHDESYVPDVQTFYWVGKTGILSFAGAILKGLQAATTGSLTVNGRLTVIDATLDRLSAAVIAPAGNLLRNIVVTIAAKTGALEFSGAMTRFARFFKSPTGILTFAGDVTIDARAAYNAYKTGILSFAGTISRLIATFREYTGEVSFAGSYSYAIELLRSDAAGSLDLNAFVEAVYVSRDVNQGYLTFVSSLIRDIFTSTASYTGSLAFVGTATPQLQVARSTANTLSFETETLKALEKLWLGPPNP